MKKGLAVRNQKREKVEKRKLKRRNKRGVSEGIFLFFIFFLSKGVSRENIITGEGDFLFFERGESTEREKLSLKACFHH